MNAKPSGAAFGAPAIAFALRLRLVASGSGDNQNANCGNRGAGRRVGRLPM
jgi:hypothetical protein